MTDCNDVQLQLSVSMATMHPTVPREEDAGYPTDLFACPDSGHFFTVQNFKVQTTPRSLNTSKSFICPKCLIKPLTIAPPEKRGPGIPLAKCSSCLWDSSNCNLTSMADLIHQCSQPYPWLYSHFRALKAIHDTDASTITNKKRPVERRDHTMRKTSLQHLMSQGIDEDCSAGITFTEKQENHEREIFKSFMPSCELPVLKNRPQHDMEALAGDIDSDDLLPVSDRKAAGLSLRHQLGPRQRVRPPHVTVKSPFTNVTVNSKWDSIDFENDRSSDWTAAYIIPKMKMHIRGERLDRICDDGNRAIDLVIDFTNRRDKGLCVRLKNMEDENQTKEIWLSPGERKQVEICGFHWTSKGVAHMGWMEEFCDKLIQLQMEVRYDFDKARVRKSSSHGSHDKPSKWEQISKHAWRVCIFGRHKLVDCEAMGHLQNQ